MKGLWIFCAVLWAAFAATGIALHRACEDVKPNVLGWVDIAGYDSEAYLRNYIRMAALFETGHRHPIIGIVLSPIIAVGATAADKFGPEAGCRAVIVCFALIGAVSFLLLWLVLAKLGVPFVSRASAAALWLSFAHVWILGGIAESFVPSMALLLGVLLMVAYGVRDVRAWIAASVIAGGVTVTNGVKPLLAWFAVCGGRQYVRQVSRRAILVFCGVCTALVLSAVAFLVVKWTFMDGFGVAKGVDFVVSDVNACFPYGVPFARRCWLVWNAFWCEPMMLHGKMIGKSVVPTAYASVWPHVVGMAVLALCAWSAITHFGRPVVRVALAMVAFDVFLHVCIGWGLEEGHLYCGHWLWIVPLLTGLLPGKAALLALPPAVFMAVHNLAIVFSVP